MIGRQLQVDNLGVRQTPINSSQQFDKYNNAKMGVCVGRAGWNNITNNDNEITGCAKLIHK